MSMNFNKTRDLKEPQLQQALNDLIDRYLHGENIPFYTIPSNTWNALALRDYLGVKYVLLKGKDEVYRPELVIVPTEKSMAIWHPTKNSK